MLATRRATVNAAHRPSGFNRSAEKDLRPRTAPYSSFLLDRDAGRKVARKQTSNLNGYLNQRSVRAPENIRFWVEATSSING
jgi:hypothetical protein